MLNKICAGIGVLATDVKESSLVNHLFGLDAQLLVDTAILALSVFALFLLLSFLLFNPARELLNKRREKINADMEAAKKEKQDALQFKLDYESKLFNASEEVNVILGEGRKKALLRETTIINEATEEAKRIHERANHEIALEKNKMRDEVKQEMISVAALLAGKMISETIDESKQNELVEDALKEIGDSTWQN